MNNLPGLFAGNARVGRSSRTPFKHWILDAELGRLVGIFANPIATSQPDGFVPFFAPQFDWVVDVVNQCRKFGVPYYLKENLLSSPGMDIPKPTPRRH